MNAVDQAFIMWEKLNQPRRANARVSACSNDPSCSAYEAQTSSKKDQEGEFEFQDAASSRV